MPHYDTSTDLRSRFIRRPVVLPPRHLAAIRRYARLNSLGQHGFSAALRQIIEAYLSAHPEIEPSSAEIEAEL
jgi:hypothetical protein